MNTKTKTLLLSIATLVVGVVIGALATGAMQHKRDRMLGEMPPHQRFRRVLERVIKPNATQHAAIEATLQRRYEQIQTLRDTFQDEVFAVYDSMRSDLASVLTEKQIRKLEARLARGPEGAVARRIEHLAEDLALSPDQKEKVHRIIKGAMEQIEEQRRSGVARTRENSRRQVFSKARKEIEHLLTPEQMEKYNRHGGRRLFPGHGPPPGPHFNRGPDKDRLGHGRKPRRTEKRVQP